MKTELSDTCCCMSSLILYQTLKLAHEQVRSKNPLVPFPENRIRQKSHTSEHRNDIWLSNTGNSPHSSFAFFTTNNPSLPSKKPTPHLDDQLHLQMQHLRTGVTSSPVVGLHFSYQLEFSTTMTLTMPPHTIPQQHRPWNLPRLSTWRAPECRCLRWCKMQSEVRAW